MHSSDSKRNIDLAKYMGTWYEIAKYPFKYQTDCDRAVAIYKWDDEKQEIHLENQCWVNGKMIRSRTGRAWASNPIDNSKLKIEFEGFPRDPSPGQYNILWTDYNTSIVAGGTNDMLWWLSRSPTVKAKDVEPMLAKIRSYGYDTDKLLAHPSVIQK